MSMLFMKQFLLEWGEFVCGLSSHHALHGDRWLLLDGTLGISKVILRPNAILLGHLVIDKLQRPGKRLGAGIPRR